MGIRCSSRVVIWVLVASMALSPLNCARQQRFEPPHSKEQVLQSEIAEAEAIEANKKQAQDQLDQRLRVASMALDAGRPDLARDTLINVTSWMAANEPEKDFTKRAEKAVRLLGGKEQEKYFLGDPYEQLFAYFYLGLLDFQAGEYDNARASFRSASFADAGSKAEGYKSDCYLAFLMEGIACRELGNTEGANEAFGMAQQAFGFRMRMADLEDVFRRGAAYYRPLDAPKKQQEQFQALYDLVYAQVPISVAISNTPEQAVDSAFGGAIMALRNNVNPKGKAEKKVYKDSPEAAVVKAYGRRKLNVAEQDLARMKEATLACVPPDMGASLAQADAQFATLVARCQDPKTNVFILQQVGYGPAKIRLGKFGERIEIRPYPNPRERMFTMLRRLDQDALPAVYSGVLGESVDFQAMTRGGRYMDSILRGKAQFKQGMNVSADVAKAVAVGSAIALTILAAMRSSSDEAYIVLAAVLFLALAVREGSMAIADAAHPEGDIRGWHELPSRIFFTCASLEPGEYEIEPDYYDMLGRAVPQTADRYRFMVEPKRTSLLLVGSPWMQ